MNNPWTALPLHEPFILEEDRQAVVNFNVRALPEQRIHLEVLPEPFLGNPSARVVLLNLNPGYDPADILSHRDNPYFIDTSRKNLVHENLEYSFYLLDPANSSSLGAVWWRKRLREVIEDCGLEVVANQVLCVEYFPYHSVRFAFRQVLPSQQYSFHLVREAIHRNALVIQMRSRPAWFRVVPELDGYANYYRLRNPQSPYVSPGNCPDGYPRIIDALQTF